MKLLVENDLPAAPQRSSTEAHRGPAAPRVAIRGWEILTPFGSMKQTWAALLAGKAIDDHARVPIESRGDRAGFLARTAAGGLNGIDSDAALVVGTSKGPVESWLKCDATPLPPTRNQRTSESLINGLADIAAHFDFLRGPKLTVSAACASGLHALIRAALMIQAGEVRQALVVAVESSLNPLFIGSFQRLGVLAKPGQGCRPFDLHRTGFLMSEAAAAILLEAESESGLDQNRHSTTLSPSLYVDRFALGGDATHVTASDPNGDLLQRLLRHVLNGGPVDLIHAHGTGTQQNDLIELAAIESVTAGACNPPVVYSHKAALGHSLGASGLVSVALNCQSHLTQTIAPNPRTAAPIPHGPLLIPLVSTRQPVNRSIAIASGFGGATAVVGLGRL